MIDPTYSPLSSSLSDHPLGRKLHLLDLFRTVRRSIPTSIGRSAFLCAFLAACAFIPGCKSKMSGVPEVQFTHVPQANSGGPEKLDYIEGTVSGNSAGLHIVIYAHSGIWWVQPFADRSATNILPSGSWKNSTHLGTEYAALLVDRTYEPPTRTINLPSVGNGVLAVSTVAGTTAASVAAKVIHFSGYDWTVRSAGSDRGGEPNIYDPANAWIDDKGFLHLRMTEREGRWTCAEVGLSRSLGYGTYKFIVQDSTSLSPSAVLGFLTFDDARVEEFASEIDVEMSQWGNAKRKNTQYVVQPFYIPENVSRFESPSGPVTHSFHWEPGRLTFKTASGAAQGAITHPIAMHEFTTGVPSPSGETVRINLYDFRHSLHPSQPSSEVVIEKFEYLP
jgi:hypothetical protein